MLNGRIALGIELKPSYYRQAVRNISDIKRDIEADNLFDFAKAQEDNDEL